MKLLFNLRGKSAFSDHRKTIKALQDFRPGMEVEDKDIPLHVLLIAFFTIIGMMATIYGFGVIVIEVIKLAR